MNLKPRSIGDTFAAVTAKGRALHDEIANSHPSLLRGVVWCTRCGVSRTVDPAECLRTGWPRCCCVTMTIQSPAEREKHDRTS